MSKWINRKIIERKKAIIAYERLMNAVVIAATLSIMKGKS